MTATTTPAKTATTTTGTAYRGTAKALRTAGIDFTQPFLTRGYDLDAPDAEGRRYERAEMGRSGLCVFAAGDEQGHWMGGVATRFWAEQIVEVPAAPVEAAAVTVTDVDDADPIVRGKHLSAMTFAEVMELAKKYKTPGRGAARIDALRAGVAKAILADMGKLAA